MARRTPQGPTKRQRSVSGNTSEGPPMKKKSDKTSFAGQNTVDIILEGNEDKPFHIHTDVLSAYSAGFGAKLEGQDGERKPLKISDISFETFDVFIKWIYAVNSGASIYDSVAVDGVDDANADSDDDGGDQESGDETNEQGKNKNDGKETTAVGENGSITNGDNAHGPSTSGDTAGSDDGYDTQAPKTVGLNAKGRVFLRLVDLYILGVRFEALSFMRAVVLTLQRLTQDWETTPCPTVAKHALDHLTLKDALVRFLIRSYAYYEDIPKTRFATLPSDFLTEVLVLTSKRAADEGDVASTDEKWCEFHEHSDESEKEACEENREDDPDVRKERNKMFRPVRRFRGCC